MSLLLGSNKSNSILGLQGALDEWAIGNSIALQVLPWEKELRPEAPYKYRSVVTLLGSSLSSAVFHQLTQTFSSRDINILRIEQLDYSDHHVIEVVIGSKEDDSTVDIFKLLVELISINILEDGMKLRAILTGFRKTVMP